MINIQDMMFLIFCSGAGVIIGLVLEGEFNAYRERARVREDKNYLTVNIGCEKCRGAGFNVVPGELIEVNDVLIQAPDNVMRCDNCEEYVNLSKLQMLVWWIQSKGGNVDRILHGYQGDS
jgi:hypothetical protein